MPRIARPPLSSALQEELGFQINCDEDGHDCNQYTDHSGTELGLVGTGGIGVPRASRRSVVAGLGIDLGLVNLFDEDFKMRTFCLYLGDQTSLGG